jgi:hypothetical protein
VHSVPKKKHKIEAVDVPQRKKTMVVWMSGSAHSTGLPSPSHYRCFKLGGRRLEMQLRGGVLAQHGQDLGFNP